MNKAIIIITTNDRKSDRFIKCTNKNDKQYQQEWEDGWGFDKTKKYALKKKSFPIVYFDEIDKLLKAIYKVDNRLVIWVNQYLFSLEMLIREVIDIHKKLKASNFDVKVAGHNIPLANYSFKVYSYSLEQTKKLQFQKIITENIPKVPILNASANFDDIEEVFFYPLDAQKKKIINLWLPLAIDIQGLSEVKNDKEKAKKYFEEVKKETEYLNSLSSFPNNNEGKNEEFPRWDEIKESLSTEYRNSNPCELVSAIKSAEEFSSFKLNDKKYLDSKISDNPNPNFLPNWLQEVVKILDEKIKQNK